MSKDKDELADMLAQADAQKLTHDPILRKAFSVGILASDLFVPVEQSEDEQAQAGGVSLQAMPINDTPHVLLFSSKEKLGAFMGANTRFARASGLDILTQLQGNFAVLNPGPTGRALAPEDIAEILGKSANPAHGETGHVHGPNCGHKH
ncbi:MAG: hypothetical protein COA43_07510 [Robiginitomaculum sp.]|nr:MAG: hypothetical protein COA43_07510 [Robiginitomaculum sp.]